MTAFELCGLQDSVNFTIGGSNIIWEAICYKQKIDKCYISRIITDDCKFSGGKPFILGLRYRFRYIKPGTKVFLKPLK